MDCGLRTTVAMGVPSRIFRPSAPASVVGRAFVEHLPTRQDVPSAYTTAAGIV